jgi:hypothetical protein
MRDSPVDLFHSLGYLDNNGLEVTSNVPLFPVAGGIFFAISHDMGAIQATQAPIVWAIGYTTDPAISYANQSDSSIQRRRPYYKSQYTDDKLLVTNLIFEQVIVLIPGPDR